MTAIGPFQLLATRFFSTHHASPGDVLAGRERPFTPPGFGLLVGRARRFTSLVTQLHLEVCGGLQISAADSPIAVFATCHGEIQTAEKLIADVRDTSLVSSARFALSVHNTASGLYSVATGSTAPTTTVTGANAIAAGWLEAALSTLEAGRTVLLSIADEPVPEVFRGPTQATGVAAGFLLGPASSSGRRVQLAVVLAPDSDEEIDTRGALARVAEASTGEEPTQVVLGRIRPGARLELRFLSQDAHA